LKKMPCNRINGLLFSYLQRATPGQLWTSGEGGAPGADTGQIALSSEKAIELCKARQEMVLQASTGRASAFDGIRASRGFVTVSGGSQTTSVRAARDAGIPVVTGCTEIHWKIVK
jgi:pyruvate,orthophosphate dikinase